VEQVQNIGEIVVEFFRKQEIAPDPQNHTRSQKSHIPLLSNLENLDVIPEKALKGKAISQRARLDQMIFPQFGLIQSL
jgi:hypothetical protein